MRSAGELWIVVLAIGLGTFAIRASFLLVASRMTVLPPLAQDLLRMIPPAVFAALVASSLLLPGGELDLWGPRQAAAVLAAVVAWWTRSVAATIAVGLLAAVAFEQLALRL